jgi:glycosyltransferase involved in cell wall biosynthesis
MPSLNEALGYSLLEALAAGVPIVASNIGGIPEVIENGKTGLLVRPGNADELSSAIKKLFHGSELRNNLVRIGPKIVQERFSLNKMLDQTKSVFQTELDG